MDHSCKFNSNDKFVKWKAPSQNKGEQFNVFGQDTSVAMKKAHKFGSSKNNRNKTNFKYRRKQ